MERSIVNLLIQDVSSSQQPVSHWVLSKWKKSCINKLGTTVAEHWVCSLCLLYERPFYIAWVHGRKEWEKLVKI